MKLLSLVLLVVGWMVAVGGLLASEALAVRLVLALIGLGTSLGGMLTLNRSHLEHAIWKRGGTLR